MNSPSGHPDRGREYNYWRWKVVFALVSLDLAEPFLEPMGFRFTDANEARALARAAVEPTLAKAGMPPDPLGFLQSVRGVLTTISERQSSDATYSVWCVAMNSASSEWIDESMYGWLIAMGKPQFLQLWSLASDAASNQIRRFLADERELTDRVDIAADSPISDWDDSLLRGGVYEDSSLRFPAAGLINQLIRFRLMSRLWVVLASAVGPDKVEQLTTQSQALLGPPDQYPRLSWPEWPEYARWL